MTQLKIVSWNIWGGKNLPEIIKCLKTLDADIIGLQEVLQYEGGGNNCAQIIAGALGCKWVYETTKLLTPAVSYLLKEQGIEKNMEWGNAVLSKYTIVDSKVHILSEARKRVALEATIKVENKDLHVFSTHLVYTSLQPSDVQVTQAENLLKVVPKENALVLGDFNATPESEVIKKISSIMVNTESDPTPNPTSSNPQIDYIFSSRNITTIARGAVDSKASDHLPIYAVITI